MDLSKAQMMKSPILMLALLTVLLGGSGQAIAGFATLNDPMATDGTIATGISGSNIVGWYRNSGNGGNQGTGYQGFLYNGTSYTTLNDPLALSNSTWAIGIDGSNIVGYYQDGADAHGNPLMHGFLYNGTTYTTLSDPLAPNSTYATGISGSNIVGYFYDGTGEHGFLYNGTTYTTLNDPLATTGTAALGIDGTNIVGSYANGTGQYGFLYTPDTTSPPEPVPEPASLSQISLGGICLAIVAYRRRRKVAEQ